MVDKFSNVAGYGFNLHKSIAYLCITRCLSIHQQVVKGKWGRHHPCIQATSWKMMTRPVFPGSHSQGHLTYVPATSASSAVLFR